jgi:hypothetical protein
MNVDNRELFTCSFVVNNRSIVEEKAVNILSNVASKKGLANEKQISVQEINRRKNGDKCETLVDGVRRENPNIMYVFLNRTHTHIHARV